MKNLRKEGVNVTGYLTSSLRWHAKIFILEKDKKNILGIIGSSNITRPAFSTEPYFNYECDVVIWDEQITELAGVIRKMTEEHDPIDLIKTQYEPEENSNISIHDKLEYLKKQFMGSNRLKEI